MKAIGIAASFLLTGAHCASARLSQSAEVEFARYIATVETRLATQHSGRDAFVATRDIGISGGTRVSPVNGSGARALSGALLHHWRAAAFVPHATAQDMLALLRDYNHFSKFYAPQVVSSRALTDHGETAALAMRLKEQKVITVVLDAEYRVESRLIGNDRGYSLSAARTSGRLTTRDRHTSAAAPKATTTASSGASIPTGASPGKATGVDYGSNVKPCRSRAMSRSVSAGC